MDTLLVLTGIGLLFLAGVLWLAYIMVERGSILDPISVSWGGYIMFVAVAMWAVGVLYPSRTTEDVGATGCLLAVLGTFTYVLGLYAGRGRLLAGRLPVPSATLSKAQVWLMWPICAGALVFTLATMPFVGPAIQRIYGGVFSGTLGALVLLSLLGFFVFRRSPITKLLMLASIAGAVIITLNFYWSRRPLTGLLIAGVGFVYRYRISRMNAFVRGAFVGSLVIAVVATLAFLTASRGHRFFGSAAGNTESMFSKATLGRFLGGLEINYRTYEFVLEEFPRNHSYMRGRGYLTAILFPIPRAVWPSKPISTGNYVSRLWYHTDDLPNTLGLPPMGELYVNFGILGVIVGMFVAGRVVRVMNTYLRTHSGNLVLWLAWLLVLPDFATEWRGDFTSMTVQPFLRVCVFLGLAWLARMLVASRTTEIVRMGGPNAGNESAISAQQGFQSVR